MLQSPRHEIRIQLSEVQDASLVERAAARDYIQQKLRKAMEEGVSRANKKRRKMAARTICMTLTWRPTTEAALRHSRTRSCSAST